MGKIKLLIVYQVIMHYRFPLYEQLTSDDKYIFKIFYGKGQNGSKLVNANLKDSNLSSRKIFTFRLPYISNNGIGTLPISPFLMFNLILNNPKVIISEGASSIFNSAIAFTYSKLFKKKFIWWSLGKLDGREYKGIRKWLFYLEKLIFKNSDAIFTYSQSGKFFFEKEGVDPKKIFTGINVLNTELKLREINYYNSLFNPFILDQKIFNVAFIGTITYEKNLDVLIQSILDFEIKYSGRIMLHIIGDGPYLDRLKIKFSENINVISFYGRINLGASQILSHCDVMVLPGLGGLAICEGMLNKLPIITGKADGTEYDLINNECGFVLQNVNKETILSKLEFLFLNPTIRLEMGKKSYHRITTDFHFNKYYKVLTDTINFVLNN